MSREGRFDMHAGDVDGYVRSLWADALGVRGDGIAGDGNFFELGGDSLSADDMANQVNADLDLDIGILAVFNNADFAEFVTFLEAELAEVARSRADGPGAQD